MDFINEASWDRIARIVVGIALLALGWGGAIGGVPGTILKFLGFVPLATGLLGWCPLYAVFGFRTSAETREAVKAG